LEILIHREKVMKKIVEVKPHEKRRGWLKYGNPPGDFMKAPRCGAKTRKGTSCKAPAMKNGRCRMHGGKSTGPKTDAGKERIRKAHLVHGKYSKVSINERKKYNDKLESYRTFLSRFTD